MPVMETYPTKRIVRDHLDIYIGIGRFRSFLLIMASFTWIDFKIARFLASALTTEVRRLTSTRDDDSTTRSSLAAYCKSISGYCSPTLQAIAQTIGLRDWNRQLR